MGGALFTRAGYYCPRLPPNVYQDLKASLVTALNNYFEIVKVPHEAPEKPDHGDIDVLVHNPTTVAFSHVMTPQHVAELIAALGAVRCESTGPGQRSFAVPVPQLDNDDKKAYVQIDLTHCLKAEKLHWLMLTHSYGDLFQVLGVQLRSIGLTFLPDNFVARIPECAMDEDDADTKYNTSATRQYSHSKRSRELTLSSDPTTVLAFLCLDKRKWDAGFADLDECYEWIASGRFFDRRTFDRADEEPAAQDSDDETLSQLRQGEWNHRRKSRDKRRKKLRPMYRRFVDEWLPAHTDAGRRPTCEPLIDRRLKILDQALIVFGKREAYEERVATLKSRQHEDIFWAEARKLPTVTGPRLGAAMRGLKTFVVFDEGKPVRRTSPNKKASKQPVWTQESTLSKAELLNWVADNWEECKRLEREREKRAEAEKAKTQV